ncbi:MAG: hypothetical protein AMXMBFR12_07920 [Candidatus Babeliales bacterium]
MKHRLLVLLLLSPFTSNASWIEFNYHTSSDCFQTGIKRVFVPFPGIGTVACLKDAIKQLPDYEKSGNLLAGHLAGLFATGCISMAALIIGLNAGIPGCKEVLGRELAHYFKIKSVKNSCE